MIWLDRLLKRRRISDDLSAEIQAHLEEKTDALLALGLSREDAESAARRAFGNVTALKERGHDVWVWPTVESVLFDVRFALRQLRRAPTLTAVVVLTLGIGVAATASVFSWTRAILIDPLPGTGDPNRVYALESLTASGSWTPTSWPDFRDLRRSLTSVSGLAAAYPTSVAIGDDAQAERGGTELVSANFFDVLGVEPAAGRFFPLTRDNAPGGEADVVIGYRLWQRRWNGDPSVIGKVVRINRFPFTVIGVAPRSFHGSMPGEDIDLWVPAMMVNQILPTANSLLEDRGWRTFRVLARLTPGVSSVAAGDEVRRVASAIARREGGRSEGMSATLLPLWQSHWGLQDTLRAPLVILLGACGLVLFIACANTANLLLARAAGRRRELGLRLALGAPRQRLARQLLTEAAILALAGSALGLVCSIWLARGLRAIVPASGSSLIDPRMDTTVLVFTMALACGVTLIAGIAPALYGSRQRLGEALGEGSRGTSGGVQAVRLRSLFVVAEVALAVISLVGAGLFYDSYRNTRGVAPGFDADHVAMGSVSLALAGFDSATADALLARVADRIAGTPGITAVSYTDYVPLSLGQGSWEDLEVEGYAPERNENMKIYRAAIGPGYFDVVRIPVLAGRGFRADDDSAHAPAMIVNETFAQHFLRGRSPLGVKVKGWGRWFTIVGVVRDAKIYRLTESPAPYFYVPVRQVYRPEYGYTFLARSRLPVAEAVSAITAAVRSADPGVPTYNAMPLADYVGVPLRGQQMAASLLGGLAAVALVLAVIGLYGLLAYAVGQRTREIGVRIALGARPVQVLGVISRNAGALILVGLGVGLACGASLGHVLSSLLYGVGSADVPVLAGACTAMVLAAAAAIAIPAHRALRVDPIIALRAD
ncbi:MAG TPA: ABC transporter permease [Gemmatimonadaceae bacterium]|nr:ABC transporter permease [Gemmatimonadaceae bacterium]